MALDKSECLRLKGIIEPLEDILKRHYGEYYMYKGDEETRHKIENYIKRQKVNLWSKSDEVTNHVLLMVALYIIKDVEEKNWWALSHQNDKLDV